MGEALSSLFDPRGEFVEFSFFSFSSRVLFSLFPLQYRLLCQSIRCLSLLAKSDTSGEMPRFARFVSSFSPSSYSLASFQAG